VLTSRAAAGASNDRSKQEKLEKDGGKEVDPKGYIHLEKPTGRSMDRSIAYSSYPQASRCGLLRRRYGNGRLVEGARRLRAGDEEAAGGGVLTGVVDRGGAHVVVRPLVGRHHVAGVILVPLHTLLHVAPFRRAPVVVPAYESND
jgi:hypothetical protein